MKTKIYFMFMLLGLLGCSGNSGSGSANNNGPVPQSEVSLAEVSDPNCINLQKYVAAMQSLYPSPAIRHIVTDVSATGSSHNFLLRLAYGNFSIANIDRSQIPELVPFQQSDCKTVTIDRGNGNSEQFQVLAASANTIRISNDNGDAYSYQWISDQHLKTVVEYNTTDILCSQTTIHVAISNDYAWDTDSQNSSTIPDDTITSALLGLETEATGTTQTSLYADDSTDPSQPQVFSIAALQTLEKSPLAKDINSCQ